MTELELHKANSINDRLSELKKHLSAIEFIEKESDEKSRPIQFGITDGGEHLTQKLRHQFLPINIETVLTDYKGYLKQEIERTQAEFDSL